MGRINLYVKESVIIKKKPIWKKVYICDICDAEAESKDKLKNHIHCVDCAIQFKSMSELNNHIQQSHTNEIMVDGQGNANKGKRKIIDNKFEIDKCRKDLAEKERRISVLMTELTTKDDIIEALNKSNEVSNKDNGWVKCDVCDVEIQNQQKMKDHVAKAHNVKCDKCHTKFQYGDMLSEHVKNVHKVNTNEVNEKTVGSILENDL